MRIIEKGTKKVLILRRPLLSLSKGAAVSKDARLTRPGRTVAEWVQSRSSRRTREVAVTASKIGAEIARCTIALVTGV